MEHEIKITKKNGLRGEDGYKIGSVRMKDETVAQLDEISMRTNRSRNEIINLLLEAAVHMVKIDE